MFGKTTNYELLQVNSQQVLRSSTSNNTTVIEQNLQTGAVIVRRL